MYLYITEVRLIYTRSHGPGPHSGPQRDRAPPRTTDASHTAGQRSSWDKNTGSRSTSLHNDLRSNRARSGGRERHRQREGDKKCIVTDALMSNSGTHKTTIHEVYMSSEIVLPRMCHHCDNPVECAYNLLQGTPRLTAVRTQTQCPEAGIQSPDALWSRRMSCKHPVKCSPQEAEATLWFRRASPPPRVTVSSARRLTSPRARWFLALGYSRFPVAQLQGHQVPGTVRHQAILRQQRGVGGAVEGQGPLRAGTPLGRRAALVTSAGARHWAAGGAQEEGDGEVVPVRLVDDEEGVAALLLITKCPGGELYTKRGKS